MGGPIKYPLLSLSKQLIESAFVDQAKDQKKGIKKNTEMNCDQCDYKTDKKNYMDNHKRGKHPKSKKKCDECNFTHAFPSKIKQHYKIVHLGIKRLAYRFRCKVKNCTSYGKNTCDQLDQHKLLFCKQCNHTVTASEELKRHVQSVHEGIVYPCDQCSYVSKRRADLKVHFMSKHNTGLYKCTEEFCSHETYSKFRLERHFESEHEGLVKYKCEFMNCNFVSDKKSDFKVHELSHSGAKCKRCKQTFGNLDGLEEHMKLNHPMKKLQSLPTNVDSKHVVPAEMDRLEEQIDAMMETSERVTLRSNGRRVMICKICKREHTKRSILRNHIESAHLTGVVHICTICGMRYKSRKYLRHHMSQKHLK